MGLRVLLAVAALLLWAGPAAAFSKQDVTVTMDDGVPIAATIYLPDGAAPAGGWPAIVLLHGLGGTRADMNALAETYGFAGEQYAVLTFDARGHGASGGLVSIDGPREVADVKELVSWLEARPDVSDRIGAWGISYGGGAIWNSLVAGVPWRAVEVAETWTDLYEALMPQGLAKSGVIAQLAGGIPAAKRTPELGPLQAAAFAGTNATSIRAFAAERSSLAKLKGVTTPAYLMPGRRDFLFGLDQALRPWALLAGPKRMWIGNHGHPPSSFPAADTAAMLADGRAWFDRFLRGVPNGIDRQPPVVLAREGSASTASFRSLPATATVVRAAAAARTIARSGKVVATFAAEKRGLETFGAPAVSVTATATGGWSRLVAVLTARTPAGKEIVVSAGGVPTAAGTRTYRIRLISQATVVPKRSRLAVTLGSSSLAQDPGNLLYLDLPMPDSARLTVRRVALSLPVLR